MADYIPSIFTSKSSYVNVLCTGGTAPIEAERSLPMAREKEGFRETLDRLDERFPGKEVIKRTELAEFLGVSKCTIFRRFQKEYNRRLQGYPKVIIAKALVE